MTWKCFHRELNILSILNMKFIWYIDAFIMDFYFENRARWTSIRNFNTSEGLLEVLGRIIWTKLTTKIPYSWDNTFLWEPLKSQFKFFTSLLTLALNNTTLLYLVVYKQARQIKLVTELPWSDLSPSIPICKFEDEDGRPIWPPPDADRPALRLAGRNAWQYILVPQS